MPLELITLVDLPSTIDCIKFMALIVQKYGGTSVGSAERIQAVAQRICKTVKARQGKYCGCRHGGTTRRCG